MAIQDIEKKSAEGTAGIERTINTAATGMIMDIVQAQQYQKPIPSTVRELTANAVDSQSEKEKAIKILSGEAKPEDYFIQREGELYNDSKWNPDYYDVNHLDKENNEIHLIYKEGEGTGRCDKFIIRDHGVGIGLRRLKGVLEVGFSTKRNRKDALGAFGLGAKVGLATGAEYYKMTTVHNGIKYSVQIFNKKVNSLVGSLNLDTGKPNIPYEFTNVNGEVVGVIYGEATDEKNYTQIEVPCLKHHKSEFENAVKTQLLFFNNVTFTIEYNDGTSSEVDFKADILHNSSNLIIAKDTPYAKPFIVIVNGDNTVGVCYGHIDFKEMELQDMTGAVGIKCQIRQTYDDDKTGEEIVVNEGVDVIASREAIRWTPATREFLVQKFEDAQIEATELVQEKLKESDFIKWLAECKNITSLTGRDTAIGRLSKIVELKNLKPKFAGTKVKYHPTPAKLLGNGLYIERNTKFKDHKDEGRFKVEKVEMDGWAYFEPEMLYVKKDGDRNRIKDVYLADKHDGKFILLHVSNDESMEKLAVKLSVAAAAKGAKVTDKDTLFNLNVNKRDEMLQLFESSELYQSYDDIVVPEDYKTDLIKLEKDIKEKEEEKVILTNAERRALEERVVANTLIQSGDCFRKHKVEPKFQQILDFEGDLYYGFQVDDSKLHYAAYILGPTFKQLNRELRFNNDKKKLLSVSKSNKKHFNMHKHIDDFFGKQTLIKENHKVVGLHVVMDNIIVKWNTARIMKERMGNLSFFRNFELIDEEMTALFKEVEYYVIRHYRDASPFEFGVTEHHEQFISFLDNLQQFQEFIETTDDKKAIVEKAKEFSLPGGTTGALAVDTEMLDKLDIVLSYAKPVRDLFNHIDILCLTGDFKCKRPEISMELGMFIKDIIKMKGLSVD